MSNLHARLIGSALGFVAAAVLCTTNNVDANVAIGVLIVFAGLFIVDYIRAQKS